MYSVGNNQVCTYLYRHFNTEGQNSQYFVCTGHYFFNKRQFLPIDSTDHQLSVSYIDQLAKIVEDTSLLMRTAF